MKHTPRLALVPLLLLTALIAAAQGTRYWVGGEGRWNDAAMWSATPDGMGGAGAPKQGDDVRIERPGTVRIEGSVWCRDLHVQPVKGMLHITGPGKGELNITGSWTLKGSVDWSFPGTVRLGARRGASALDLCGTVVASDVVFDGSGEWDIVSDVHVVNTRAIVLRQGVLMANSNHLRAGEFRLDGRKPKRLIAGSSVVQLERGITGEELSFVEPGSATLIVAGVVAPWEAWAESGPEGMRGINICGTGPGQTPFTINAQLVSNYNGFGISCRGACDGVVTVTVTGGVGPFAYQWISGPTTATWTNTCAGNQIVIVTDLGQGIGCAATIQVTDPALLGVIFFGGTPPTCHDVCNGTLNGFAVGGATPYTYNWNNGAGSGSSFNQLCAGVNTLQITDANGCVRDTTFIYPVQPIEPNLTFTNVSCFGSCDGTAQVAPVGGTGTITVTWAPAPGAGQGTPNATGLCPGPYQVTLVDANGCDTTIAFTINQPPPIVPNPSQTDASCADACDGTATVAPTGPTGPFTFSWSPAPGGGQGTANATGLCAGLYQVTITDVPTGCDTLVSITILSPPAIVPQLTATDATCANSCDGTASVNPAGGTPGYTIVWSPAPGGGQGTPTASGLCPGNYTVTITDAALCDTTVSFTITAPPPFDITTSFTDVTCAALCDGTAGVLVSGGTPGYNFFWSPNPPSGQGTPNAVNICAGTWSVLISDAAGCDTLITFLISEPPPLTATPTQTNVTCAGACDGTADVVLGGGTPGYTYAWSPAPGGGQGTPNATGLCAGTYTLLITDANNCTLSVPVTITEPPALLATLSVTDASCPSACDGAANVVVIGGTPAYTFLWTPAPGAGQGTANATGLCVGNYSVLVTDLAGCDTLINFSIAAQPAILPNEVVTNATCANACDGSIVLAPTGGTGAFTYTWVPVPPNGQGTAQATGLCAGTYEVTITSGACDTTLTLTITAPPPLDVTGTVTSPTCAGQCDGAVDVLVSGGTPGYTFFWTPAPGAGQGTSNATGLCAGPYTVLISDAVGCDTLITFDLLAPVPIEPNLTTTVAGCGGACDGTASVAPTGGAPGYLYDWQPAPGAGQGTPDATGLCPGPHTVTITDAAGCDTTIAFIISTPSGIQSTPIVTPASCADLCDGTIVLTTSGGVPPYDFNWVPAPATGQGTGSVGGLCAGTYSVTITDQAACDTILIIDVTAPDAIVPNEAYTNETCDAPCTGTASFAPLGGAGGFSFSWSPVPPEGQGVPVSTQLCAGIWSVLITDAAGCDTLMTFEILPNQPVDVALDVTDATCAGACDGEATVTVLTAVPPVQYLWSPSPGGGQGSPIATGLCAGSYTVTITDATNCDTTMAFTIVEPAPLVPIMVMTSETCAGPCTGAASVSVSGGVGTITYDWQPAPGGGQGTPNATGLCASTSYTLTLTDSTGCSVDVPFNIAPYAPIIPNETQTDANCAGGCDGTASVAPTGGIGTFTYLWTPAPGGGQGTPNATGLCAGAYSVLVTDSVGCDTTVNFLITEPTPIEPNATVSDVACAGDCNGSVLLSVTGGTAPHSYIWSPVPPNGQGNASALGLCAGDYTVTISDGAGCDTTLVFTIAEPAPLALTIAAQQSQCLVCDGSVEASMTGGVAPYTFTLDGPGGIVSGPDSVFPGLCAGLYDLLVTDQNGCSTQGTALVSDANGEVLTITDGAVSCPGDCDGAVNVAFTCGDPPCTIAWFDGVGTDLGVATNDLTNLCAGDYVVQVTNASGCISLAPAVVTEPLPIVAVPAITMVSCFGACDGSIVLTPSGGAAPYTYTWSPVPPNGQGNSSATSLCPGNWGVTITDDAGCSISLSVDVTEPTELLATGSVTPIICNGSCDGAIALTATGGSGSYSYVWSPTPPVGQGTPDVSGLCAGVWNVTVTDSAGCSFATSFTLNEPPALQVGTTATNSQCLVCNGAVDATVTGGVGPYAITWTDLNGDTVGNTAALTDLCAGLYTVNVTDDNGCAIQATVAITDTDAEVLTMIDGTTTCSNTCNGSVEVSFACSDPACTVTWYDINGTDLGQSGNVLTNLCPGEYIVLVTNASGCIAIDTASVTPAQVLLPNLSSTPESCAGACDGTATVNPDGGTAPYQFLWSPAPPLGQGTAQVSGLCPGVWQVTITDDGGCDTTVTVLITGPSPILPNESVTDASCAGDCNGTISLAPSGGVGPYAFTWSPVPPNGQGNSEATGLCAGSIAVTITDASGCAIDTTFTIAEPLPLLLGATNAPSQCQVCVGSVAVQPAGGTAPYIYAWTDDGGTAIGTDSLVTSLCAGFYFVSVTDANGCSATLMVPVTDIDGEVLTMTDGAVSCPGDCDGEVSVAFTCGDTPCTVEWFDDAGNDLGAFGAATVGNLCPGLYLVYVTNASGCISIDTAFVTTPPPLVANSSSTPVTCSGDCDGTATVGPTGGTPGYTYAWTPAPSGGQGTPQATGLCAGVWEVLITDTTGCAITETILVTDPGPITAAATITPASCAGGCDGAIDLVVSGGTLPYTFSWTPLPPVGDGSANVSGLCIGTWTVVIADAAGCSVTFSYDVPAPSPLAASVTTTDNACFGDCDGTAAATVSGGTAPLQLSWLDASGVVIAADTTELDGLCAGDYSLLVVDDNGCDLTVPFTITEGLPIITGLSVIGESCNGPCDGTAEAQPSAGAAPYDFTWTDPLGAVFASGVAQVNGMCAGIWTLTVTDDNGCALDTLFEVLPYTLIAFTDAIQDVSCNGACDGAITLVAAGGLGALNYSWTPTPAVGQGTPVISGLCANTWNAVITDAAGCSVTYSGTVTEPTPVVVAIDSIVPATCSTAQDGAIYISVSGGLPPYQFLWTATGGFTSTDEDLVGVLPLVYDLQVTDANGCQQLLQVTVPALNPISADAGQAITQCEGGTITLDGSASTGGSAFTWLDDGGNTVGTNATVTIPAPGPGSHVYTLVVSDGPCTDSAQVSVVILDTPIADAGPDRTIFVDQTTELGGSPTGPPGAGYVWAPDSVLTSGTAANPTAAPTVTTWFVVQVTASNGCVDVDSVLVTVLPEISIPSGFSPNGDGWNDQWIISFIQLFPNVEVEVYNRWGEMLFQSVGYGQPWDGRYKGGLVPTGTYYYVINLNDAKFPEPYTGPLTVLR
ncbi:MAG: gliding motility-associated C-terminal domain-containing protein [Flavobacteriales bacterium]|nr:gliding motility-associated C-terminal domain-containing protein [Flavobacteriales bacterium]